MSTLGGTRTGLSLSEDVYCLTIDVNVVNILISGMKKTGPEMSGDMPEAPSRGKIGPAFKPCGWAGSVTLARDQTQFGKPQHSVPFS